jgi:undecaprenyl-diphosphatase
MFAVIVYFWRKWRSTCWQSMAAFKNFAGLLALASVLTGVVAEASMKGIEKTVFRDVPHAQIEDLFSRLDLIAPALALAGVLILIAGILDKRGPRTLGEPHDLNLGQAALIGAVQGLCLPFRGFSRSGATISVGILAGVPKSRAETFSFALAVVLTPPVVARETMRLMQAEQVRGSASLISTMFPSLVGSVLAFLAGLVAQPMARRRKLVSVRHLLPGSSVRGGGLAPYRLLSACWPRLKPGVYAQRAKVRERVDCESAVTLVGGSRDSR